MVFFKGVSTVSKIFRGTFGSLWDEKATLCLVYLQRLCDRLNGDLSKNFWQTGG